MHEYLGTELEYVAIVIANSLDLNEIIDIYDISLNGIGECRKFTTPFMFSIYAPHVPDKHAATRKTNMRSAACAFGGRKKG